MQTFRINILASIFLTMMATVNIGNCARNHRDDEDSDETSEENAGRSKCRCVYAWFAKTSDVMSPGELKLGRVYTRPRKKDRFWGQHIRYPVLEPFIHSPLDDRDDNQESDTDMGSGRFVQKPKSPKVTPDRVTSSGSTNPAKHNDTIEGSQTHESDENDNLNDTQPTSSSERLTTTSQRKRSMTLKKHNIASNKDISSTRINGSQKTTENNLNSMNSYSDIKSTSNAENSKGLDTLPSIIAPMEDASSKNEEKVAQKRNSILTKNGRKRRKKRDNFKRSPRNNCTCNTKT